MFPTIHQRPIPYLGTHSSGWIFIHKNRQGNVWNKIVSHHSLQSAYLSHGATLVLSSALRDWTFGTQDQKNNFFYV